MPNMVINVGANVPQEALAPNYEVWRDVSMQSKTRPDGDYAVEKLVNVKAVQNSLRQCFSWIPGERVLLPEFGSKLNLYLYEGITKHNVEQIMAEIRGCVSRWEPRVQIQNVVDASTDEDTEHNTVVLDIIYTIPGLTDEQFKYTYVYHRQAV